MVFFLAEANQTVSAYRQAKESYHEEKPFNIVNESKYQKKTNENETIKCY